MCRPRARRRFCTERSLFRRLSSPRARTDYLMFLRYYGLREQPFGFTPDPRFLFGSESCREAHASLLYAIENNVGFSALIAEPGMGKTTLLFDLLERLRETARTGFLFTTQDSSRDLLRYINLEFELPDCGGDSV